MTIPASYSWLSAVEGKPRIITEALALLGVTEAPGAVNNDVIMGWAAEIGGSVEDVYRADSIPWCGLFAAVVCKRAGKTPPKLPLWALSWSSFGVPVHVPMLGDVLVFKRDGGGHVGFYVAEDEEAYHVLGGNTSDQVMIARISKQRLYAARRPEWVSAAPAGRKSFHVATGGALSTNEA